MLIPQVAETKPPQPMDAVDRSLLYDLSGSSLLIKLNNSRGNAMKKTLIFVLLAVLLTTLAACAPASTPKDTNVELGKSDTQIQFTPPGPNPNVNKPAKGEVVAGLVTGLWHGFIAPVTLVVSFFNPEIQMYDVFNTGSLYNLGFLLGVAIIFLLLGFSGGRSRKRSRS